MIDIHAHFLPSIDDGATDVEMSIQMLTESSNQGVEVCVATPHCVLHKHNDLRSFLAKREESATILKAELEKKGIKHPRLMYGAEVMLDNDINAYPGIEQLCIDDTPYMLLEFDIVRDSRKYADWLYSLTLRGIKPIIAHIDRYPDFDLLIREFKGIDIIYQINASRFNSFLGRRIIKHLLNYNNTYIVSSDMHNMAARRCNMQSAYQKALKKFPAEADKLFILNGQKILEETK
ncbi:MAG: hypothetical protein IJQ50_00175 [Clostridia bacterium]|nr:hypothetical protein [Clostridia bacterium]MBR0276866.1 hypothetical protein [Clostridia bacterium]